MTTGDGSDGVFEDWPHNPFIEAIFLDGLRDVSTLRPLRTNATSSKANRRTMLEAGFDPDGACVKYVFPTL